MSMDILDSMTSADESLEGVNRRLDQIGHLLESQMASEGVTDLSDDLYHPQAFEYAAVPTDETHRLGLPAGQTVIDFERGEVIHETEGVIAEIRDFDDMSEGVDTRVQSLRSAWFYTDVPIQARFDEGNWFPLDSCQYTPVKAQGFKRIVLQSSYPFEFFTVASTRSEPFSQSDSVTVHMDREGTFSGTPDSWTRLEWAPHHLREQHGMTYAGPKLHTVSFSTNTLMVENTGNNDLYTRLVAADTHNGKFYTIERREASDGTLKALSPGDHHVYHCEQHHHLLGIEVQNATAGNVVETFHSMSGGSK